MVNVKGKKGTATVTFVELFGLISQLVLAGKGGELDRSYV